VLPGYRRSVFPWSPEKGRVEGMTILLNLTDTSLAKTKVIYSNPFTSDFKSSKSNPHFWIPNGIKFCYTVQV
jgi:hypothetical protein